MNERYKIFVSGGGETLDSLQIKMIDDAFTISLNFLRFSFDFSNGLL